MTVSRSAQRVVSMDADVGKHDTSASCRSLQRSSKSCRQQAADLLSLEDVSES